MVIDMFSGTVAVIQGINVQRAETSSPGDKTARSLAFLAASTLSSLASVLQSMFEEHKRRVVRRVSNAVRAFVVRRMSAALQMTTASSQDTDHVRFSSAGDHVGHRACAFLSSWPSCVAEHARKPNFSSACRGQQAPLHVHGCWPNLPELCY